MRDMSLKLKRMVLENNWNEFKCELIPLSRYCSLPRIGHRMLAEEYETLKFPIQNETLESILCMVLVVYLVDQLCFIW